MTRFTSVLLLMLSASCYPIAVGSAQRSNSPQKTPSAYKTANANAALRTGQIVRDCADCPDMVAVPEVGHAASDPGTVFYAGRFEVTWRQYLVAVRDGICPVPLQGYNKPHDVYSSKINDDYPLTGISPDVFPCYLKWIHKKTGRVYRVPSASEWEHITRAGTVTEYYWGDGLGYDNAVVFDYFNAKELQKRLRDTPTSFREDSRGDVKWKNVYPVGQFKPNPWGLYDVIGNAAEVTTESYPPLPTCLKNQPARVCDAVSVRGNDRVRSPNPMTPNPPITESLTTTRFRAPAHGGTSRTGFRVVRD